MSALDRLRETSLKDHIIRFVQLIAKDKLEKMDHPHLYVQLVSKKPVVHVSDGHIEVKTTFPKKSLKLKNTPVGTILLVTDWKLMISLNETAKETEFEIAIAEFEKVGTAPIGRSAKQPGDEPELEFIYTILSRAFEAKKFNNFYNANKALDKIRETLSQIKGAESTNEEAPENLIKKKKTSAQKNQLKFVGPQSASKFSPKMVEEKHNAHADYFDEEVEEEVPRRFIPLQRGNEKKSGHHNDEEDEEWSNYIRERQRPRQMMETESNQPQKRNYDIYSHQINREREGQEDPLVLAKRGKFTRGAEDTRKQAQIVENRQERSRFMDSKYSNLLMSLSEPSQRKGHEIEEEEEDEFNVRNHVGNGNSRILQPVTSYKRNDRDRDNSSFANEITEHEHEANEENANLNPRQRARIEITKMLLQQDQENREKQASEKKRRFDLDEKKMLMKMMAKPKENPAIEKPEPSVFSRESFIASSFFELGPKDTHAFVEKPVSKTKNSGFGKLTAPLHKKNKEVPQEAEEGGVLKEIQNSSAMEERGDGAPQERNEDRTSVEDMRILLMLMKQQELENLL